MNQTIQIEEELPLSSTGFDVEAEHLTTDNSSNLLKTSGRQKQPQYDALVPQQTIPLPPPIPENWQEKTTTQPEPISPTLHENEENTVHSSVLDELLTKSVHLKPTAKKIPRPARPPNGRAAAMLEASNPIQEAIFTMLCELTEENEGEAEEIFNDNDSGFGDLSITIPEAKKEQAKKATERLIVAREPFYSMEDERISDIATRICDAKSITEELVSDLMDWSSSDLI